MNRIWLIVVLVLGVFLYFMYKKQNDPAGLAVEEKKVETMIEKVGSDAEKVESDADKAAEKDAADAAKDLVVLDQASDSDSSDDKKKD